MKTVETWNVLDNTYYLVNLVRDRKEIFRFIKYLKVSRIFIWEIKSYQDFFDA